MAPGAPAIDLISYEAAPERSMSRSQIPSSGTPTVEAPRVALAKEAATRLSVSTTMLRKLTLAGEIGHVRLGTGRQRQRIGYTEAQIDQFIAARTVPPAPREPEPDTSSVRARRRVKPTAPEAGTVASTLVSAALKRGSVAEWAGSS